MRTETDISGRSLRGHDPLTRGLRVIACPAQGLVDLFVPTEAALVIGREPGPKGLAFADPHLSTRHVAIYPEADGSLLLLDLGSKNGTFVNGVRTATGRLVEGDIVRAGGTLLAVTHRPDPEFPESPAAQRVGRSPLIQAAWAQARAGATHPIPVLIIGPTGAGKEGVARLVHDASGRRGPFLAANCATLGGEMATATLFGHERGAFTGAAVARKGLFREAEGGTLFLDEIGELPAEIQPRLLRALEQGEITPVGASRPLEVDVRVVAATNALLATRAEHGTFRADLYARLAGWIIELPPLAARREDVLRLARHFAGLPPQPPIEATPLFEPDLAEALVLHDWPYNVRELRQLMARLTLVATPPFALGDLPEPLHGPAATARTAPLSPPTAERERPAAPPETPRLGAGQRPSKEELVSALAAHDGNVAAVGRFFGRDRKQVYRWALHFGITLVEE